VANTLSLRLPESMAAKVRTIAAMEQRSLADTVRILADEAIRQREFPEIYFMDGATGRRARLFRGPDVWEVLQPYLLAGKDWEALRESYPEVEEDVLRAALRYYEAYPDEIDARVAFNLGE
jgi:hypothetical protein